MNQTQKIVIEETFFTGLSVPSGISIIGDYLIPVIKETGLQGIFGSFLNILLTIISAFLFYASYQWITNIIQNIERTQRIMYYEPDKFNIFIIKIILTFIITFFVTLFLKNWLGL